MFLAGCGNNTNENVQTTQFPENIEYTSSTEEKTLENFEPEEKDIVVEENKTPKTNTTTPPKIPKVEPTPSTPPAIAPKPLPKPEPITQTTSTVEKEPEKTGNLNIIVNTETKPPETTPEPTPPTETAPTNYASTLLALINTYRAENNLPALTNDSILANLSTAHNTHMSGAGTLSHDGFNDRYTAANRSTCVENVGWNYRTAATMFEGWKNSDGHNKNMLNKNITHAGIAVSSDFYITFFACSHPR